MMLREPWRTRLLFVSFAVNLVTIPMAGMRYFGHFGPPPLPPGPPRPQMMVERLTKELPPADGEKFRSAVEPHIEEIEVARVRMEAARTAMLRAIGSTPFEPEAVQASMRKWQQSWKAWSDGIGVAMLAGLQDVSAEGRQQLAEAGLHRRHR